MASSAVKIVLNAVDQYSGTISGLHDGLELVGSAFSIVTKASTLAFDALKGGLVSLGETGNKFEQLKIKMESIFGGVGPAKKALDWATEFGAKTPLELDEVAKAMIKLKTFGFDPFDGTLQKLGDTAFALGTDFDGIVTALGQMKLKGKVSQEELNQLAERNIPAIRILQKEFKLTAEQMGSIGKQGLDVNRAISAIVNGLGESYAGAMQKASNTAKGAFSTINDIIEVFKKNLLDQGAWNTFVSYVVGVRDVMSKTLGSDVGKNISSSLGNVLNGVLLATEQVAKSIFSSIGLNVDDVLKSMERTLAFARNGTTSTVKFLVKGFYTISKEFANVWNGIIDAVIGFNFADVVSGTVKRIVQLFAWLAEKAQFFMIGVTSFVVNSLKKMLATIESLAQNNPTIAKLIGLSPQEIASTSNTLDGLTNSVLKSAKNAVGAFRGLANGADAFLTDFNSGLGNIKISVESIEEAQQNAVDAIASNPISAAVGEDVVNVEEYYKKYNATILKSSQVEAAMTLAKMGAHTKLTGYQKAYYAAQEKSMDKVIEKTKAIVGETSDLKKEYKNAFDIAKKEYDDLTRKLSLGVDVSGRKFNFFETRDMEKQLKTLKDKLTSGLKTTAQLDIEYKTKNEVLTDIIKKWGGTNWPQAWTNMAKAFMEMLIARAAGENIPLTITNYSPL